MKIKIILFISIFLSIIVAQGTYSILSNPYSVRSLGLSNSSSANEINSLSYNPASIKADGIILGFHSIYLPLDIVKSRFELIIPCKDNIFFSDITSLDYGSFKDGITNNIFKSF